MKDTSLRVPSGMNGTVIDVQVFTREGIEATSAQSIIDEMLRSFQNDLADQMRIVERDAFARIERMIVGQPANGGPGNCSKGTAIARTISIRSSPPLVRHPHGRRGHRRADGSGARVARKDPQGL